MGLVVEPWVCADLGLSVGLCQSRHGGGAVCLLDDLGLGVGLYRSRRGGGAVGVIEGRDKKKEK